MSAVAVYSYTQSTTYVTDNVLKSLKDVIRLSGLSPENLVNSWDSKHRAIKTWLESRHLERVELEIYNPLTNALIVRWDLDIVNRPGFELTPRSWTNFKGFHEEVRDGVQTGSGPELLGRRRRREAFGSSVVGA